LYYDQQMHNNRGPNGKYLQLQKHQAKELIVRMLVSIQNNQRCAVHVLKFKKNYYYILQHKNKTIKLHFQLVIQFCPSRSCK
jgi:hypothetical protein